MAEALIRGLIALVLLVVCVEVAFWVFAMLGIMLPMVVHQAAWVIVALIALLYLIRALRGNPNTAQWLP